MNRMFSLLIISCLFVFGCAHEKYNFKGQTEDARINNFFDWSFDKIIHETPEEMAYIGIKKRQGDLNDLSYTQAVRVKDMLVSHLGILKSFDRGKLSKDSLLSYDVFEYTLKSKIDKISWRDYNYPVNQMFGVQSHLPNFMTSIHKIESYKDATNYISRLNQFDNVLSDTTNNLMRSENRGVLLPKFVYAKVIRDCGNIIKGRPFVKQGKDSLLLSDFKNKITKINLTKKEKIGLLKAANLALLGSVKPAYENLITFLKSQEKRATNHDGAWKFPQGKEFYEHRIAFMTTTEMSPDEVHELGLKNVKRIQGEMRALIKKIGFKGSLKQFFEHLKMKKFRYPDTSNGKKAYIKKAKNYISKMRSELDHFFITKPKATIEIRPVESYREKSSGMAFYQTGTPDGSRPGVYYVNLSNMKELPKWEAQALAYHEGIPGHHMQLSIAQELKTIPKFRRYLTHFTAYIEGWGLYSERFPKEFGFYKDPYSDFGRLSMEIFRAARLVVDTGIHWKKWTRQQAVDYLVANAPGDVSSHRRSIDRYTIWPGQATGYMVGMLKILELRKKAKSQLKGKFDIREFHNVILTSGSIPLSILERRIDGYISDVNQKNLN